MARAIWNDTVIAESDDIVEVEGNLYFPMSSLSKAHFSDNSKTSFCPWKGTASYFDITVSGAVNNAAAWYYSKPKKKAREIENRVAFWRGVKIEK